MVHGVLLPGHPAGPFHVKKRTLAILTLAFYALHQDFWSWGTATPLFFGFLPVGLAYHACYSIAAAVLMAALVRWAWPEELARNAKLSESSSSPGAGEPPA